MICRKIFLICITWPLLALAVDHDVTDNICKNTNKIPLIWNLPLANSYFVGRQQSISEINKHFLDKHATITIAGIGGIGKTQLAKKYANQYKCNYDLIWWFDSVHNLNIQFKELAAEINKHPGLVGRSINMDSSDQHIAAQLKDILRTQNLNWLLIFDNALDPDSIIDYMPEKHNDAFNSHIIITSRDSLSWNNIIHLHEFDINESIELLEKITKLPNRNDLAFLADKLGNYPLILAQIGAYIIVNPEINMDSIKEYLAKDKRAKIPAQLLPGLDNYTNTIHRSLSLSIDKIRSSSQDAFDLLVFCSLINNRGITRELLEAMIKHKNGSIAEINIDEALNQLLRHSLIIPMHNQRAVNSDQDNMYYTNEVVQLVIQNVIRKKERRKYIETSLKVLSDLLYPKISFFYSRPYIPDHVKRITTNAIKHKVINNDLLRINIATLEFELEDRINYEESNLLISLIQNQIMPKIRNIDDNLAIHFLFNKAMYYTWRDSDFAKGIKELETAQNLMQVTEKLNDQYAFFINTQLAQFYIFLGKPNEAEYYAHKADLTFNYNKHSILEKAGLNATKATIYRDQGNYPKAYEYVQLALNPLDDSNQDTPNTASYSKSNTYIHLLEAEILLKLGKLQQAYDKALTIYKQAKLYYGNNIHNIIGMALVITANAANQLGKAELAKKDIRESIGIFNAFYANQYMQSDAALAHMVQGDIYFTTRSYTEAYKEYLEAEQIFNNIFDTPNTDDMSLLYTKLALTTAKLNNQLKAHNYIQLHKQYFGSEHPWTIRMLNAFFKNNIPLPA